VTNRLRRIWTSNLGIGIGTHPVLERSLLHHNTGGMAASDAGLLSLPDELLLDIAQRVNDDDFPALSLTCRHLQCFGQDGLIRTATLPLKNVWKLADTLRERPDLANNLVHLQLGTFDRRAYDCIKESLPQQVQTIAYDTTYGDIISQKFPSDNDSMRFEDVSEVGIYLAIGIMVVLALSPRLIAVSMCNNALHGQGGPGVVSNFGCFLPKSQHHPLDERGERVRAYLEARIEKLRVIQERAFIRPRPIPIPLDFSRCKKLKHLEVPCGKIAFSRWQRTVDLNTRKLLPESLETLCVTWIDRGNHNTLEMLRQIVEAGESLPALRSIDFRSEYNLITVAWRLCSRQYRVTAYLSLLRSWNYSTLTIVTTFGHLKDRFHANRDLPDSTPAYTKGDMVSAMERFRATDRACLRDEPDVAEALGIVKNS
jgi:hypothetical protein